LKARRGDSFTRLDSVADGLLRRSARGESALLWLQARWDRIVGEPLARKVTPRSLEGSRLTLELLDPLWRKPVAATLPELERKLASEMPEIKPKVTLRG
jgi:Dna[CI] antecedent, DciA